MWFADLHGDAVSWNALARMHPTEKWLRILPNKQEKMYYDNEKPAVGSPYQQGQREAQSAVEKTNRMTGIDIPSKFYDTVW